VFEDQVWDKATYSYE